MFPLHHFEPPMIPNTVLIVDDEPFVRAVVARQLTTAGFDVVEAGNGADAVTQFFRHQPMVVGMVLDLMMPESRGEVALSIIRGVAPNLPVIVATGTQPDADVRYRPVGEPEVTVLIKPLDGSTLVRELRRLIDGE
jgi:CheY-like chemotaxis protein